jgi:hypothetical protein
MRLQVRVFDKDDITDDSLGFVDVPLGEDDFSGGGSCSQLLHNVAYAACGLLVAQPCNIAK